VGNYVYSKKLTILVYACQKVNGLVLTRLKKEKKKKKILRPPHAIATEEKKKENDVRRVILRIKY